MSPTKPNAAGTHGATDCSSGIAAPDVIDDGMGSTGHPDEIAEDRRRRCSELTDRYGRDTADEIWQAAQQRVHKVWEYGRPRAISEGKW